MSLVFNRTHLLFDHLLFNPSLTIVSSSTKLRLFIEEVPTTAPGPVCYSN